MKRIISAIVLAFALLFTIAPAASAAVTSGSCVTGGVEYTMTLNTTGKYLSGDPAKPYWKTDSLRISNNLDKAVDIKLYGYSNGKLIWSPAEFRDGDGNWSTNPPDLMAVDYSWYKAVLDRGFWYSDCTVSVKPYYW